MEQTRIDDSDSATQEYFEKFVLEFIKPTILGKILGTKWRNAVKLERKKRLLSTFGCFLTASVKV